MTLKVDSMTTGNEKEGRGAMTTTSLANACGMAVSLIPVNQITTPGQIRDHWDEERLAGLQTSVEAVGLLVPIIVRRVNGVWVVVDGHGRLEIFRRLGEESIPAIEQTGSLDPAEVLVRSLVANVQRLELSDPEMGRTLTQIMQLSGWTAAATSRKTGVSQSTICRLTATNTDPEIARLVSEGRLAPSTAYELVRVRDSAERQALVEQALDGKLTRDDVAAKAQSLKRIKRERPVRMARRGRIVLQMGGRRTVTVAGPDLTASSLMNWLAELFSRLSGLSNVGELTLAGIASSISGGK